MSEPFSNPESAAAENPSVRQAADDLREAAGQKARQVASSAEDRAHQLKAAAAQKAQQFSDVATDKAHDLKEAASDRAQRLKSAAEEQWEDTRVRAREAHSNAEDYIRDHPSKSILIAAGVGFVIGLIVRR